MNTGNAKNTEELESKIINHMNLYFKAKDSFQYLTEDNKARIGRVNLAIAEIPKDSIKGQIVNNEIDKYLDITKKIGDTKGLKAAQKAKEQSSLALVRVKEEKQVPYSSKAAFVNIAIILYGVLNIGFILAIALMK